MPRIRSLLWPKHSPLVIQIDNVPVPKLTAQPVTIQSLPLRIHCSVLQRKLFFVLLWFCPIFIVQLGICGESQVLFPVREARCRKQVEFCRNRGRRQPWDVRYLYPSSARRIWRFRTPVAAVLAHSLCIWYCPPVLGLRASHLTPEIHWKLEGQGY